MFLAGIILGSVFGTTLGIIIMSLMASSSKSEKDIIRFDTNYMFENSKEVTPYIDNDNKQSKDK